MIITQIIQKVLQESNRESHAGTMSTAVPGTEPTCEATQGAEVAPVRREHTTAAHGEVTPTP